MSDKILTFKIEGPGGTITAEDPKTLIEMLFGTGDYPHTSCSTTLQEFSEQVEVCGPAVYTITMEKRFTRAELEALPESDGDIH